MRLDHLAVYARCVAAVCLLATTNHTLAQCLGKAASKAQPLTFAVVPQLPAALIYARWAPILQRVGNDTDLCFDLQIPPSVPAFETQLLKGKPDLAFANPYHAVMAHRERGYLPLLADGHRKAIGILVVKKNGPITKLSDLKGQTVDFPAPNAFAASLLIRAALSKMGIHISPNYAKTHSNVYRSVIIGDAVAGGGIKNILLNEPAEIQNQLSVIFETPAYMPHPIIANPKLVESIRSKFTAAFIALKADPETARLLEAIQVTDPIRVDYKKDYAPLEKLGLEKYVVLEKN